MTPARRGKAKDVWLIVRPEGTASDVATKSSMAYLRKNKASFPGWRVVRYTPAPAKKGRGN